MTSAPAPSDAHENPQPMAAALAARPARLLTYPTCPYTCRCPCPLSLQPPPTFRPPPESATKRLHIRISATTFTSNQEVAYEHSRQDRKTHHVARAARARVERDQRFQAVRQLVWLRVGRAVRRGKTRQGDNPADPSGPRSGEAAGAAQGRRVPHRGRARRADAA